MSLPALHLARAARPAEQVATLIAVGVLADQVTKATATDPVVNERGTVLLLPDPIRLLWAHPHLGAALDLLDVVPLSFVLLLALRATGPTDRAGWALMFAGWISNWADRLGMSALTQPGSPRGAVDWLRLHGWPGVWNLADVLIAAGAITVAAVGLRRVGGRRPLAAGLVVVCALAVWVGVWSGDRRAAEAAAAAARLQDPVATVAWRREVLEGRARRAREQAAAEEARTVRAALAAQTAGRADAQDLLPDGYWFACLPGAGGGTRRDACVVLTGDLRAPVLAYPVPRPAWAARVGLPRRLCDRSGSGARCPTPGTSVGRAGGAA